MKEENSLTAQESLDIITSMIREAKGNMSRNGFYFLLWGWVIIIANLGMYALQKVGYQYFYIVWAITVPAWIISMVRGFREGKAQHKTTHLDTISMWVWVTFGITIFTLVAFGSKINYQLNPVILTISSIPTFLSGVLIRFKPLMLGGISFWIFGIISFLTPVETQPLVGALAILCGYIVPGYILKTKE
ncbi:MAG TPA: hypothetical protein VGD40_04745 [Chryseosolibacter sp.]